MKRALWVMVGLLVIVVIMNINLAMELSDLRDDVVRAEPTIEREIADAERRLAQAVDKAEASTDIKDLQGDLKALERAVFGAEGAPTDLPEDVSGLEEAVVDLRDEIAELTDCFNGALEASIDSVAKDFNYNVYFC